MELVPLACEDVVNNTKRIPRLDTDDKDEDGPIRFEGARVLTTLYFDFSDAQGQLTQ